MTIPMLPGWGDDFAKLPQIGQQLAQLIAPQRYASSQLKQAIQKDPRLLSLMATLAKDNPSGIEKMFGKEAAGFLGGLNETPEAQLARGKAGATLDAMGNASVRADAGLIGATGQTSAQRRTGEANANVSEINSEQARIIRDALSEVHKSNPALFDKLSKSGALKQVFGQDELDTIVKENQASGASASMEGRKRVDSILNMGVKDAYKMFTEGKISVGDLGSAFDDPRSQGLKFFFNEQQNKEHEGFILDKQAQHDRERDKQQQKMIDSLDERARLKLQAEKDKQAQDDKKSAESRINVRDIQINKFLASTNPDAKTPFSEEQIAAMIPQMNEFLQRNQLDKGLPLETAPKFVMQKTGGILGFGQHPIVKILDPDGSDNAEYNKDTKTTTTQGRSQTPSDTTGVAGKVAGAIKDTFTNKLSSELSAPAKKIVDIARSNKLSRADVTGHQSFKLLSKPEQDQVIAALDKDRWF